MTVARLRPTLSYAAFLEDPLGRYFVDQQFVAWAASPTLIGYTLWGSPTGGDVESISRPIELPRPQNIAPRCNVLINLRRIHSVEMSSFEQLLSMTRDRLQQYEARIARQAIVRPDGLVGAIAEGFANLFTPRYGWRVVDSVASALAWLGETAMREHIDTIERLVDEVRGESAELVRLRAWLPLQASVPDIDDCARALHLSRRSLQRMLRAAGSSFREECERHVLARALRYLRETDDKVEVIAFRLGFATPSSFAVFFRRRTGRSPSESRG